MNYFCSFAGLTTMNSKMIMLASFCFALLLVCTKAHFGIKNPGGKRNLNQRKEVIPSSWDEAESFPSSTKHNPRGNLRRPPQPRREEGEAIWWEK
jgi:hypothetical protein